MPHTPSRAKFLMPQEREVASLRMKHDSHGAEEEIVDDEHLSLHWVRMAILSPNTWFCSLAWFFLLIPIRSSNYDEHVCAAFANLKAQRFSLFLPTIIQTLGYTTTKAQLYTVPPNVVAFSCVLLTAAFSDHFKMRVLRWSDAFSASSAMHCCSVPRAPVSAMVVHYLWLLECTWEALW